MDDRGIGMGGDRQVKFHYFILFAALEAFLMVSWMGFINIPPISLTTLHIPVLMVALACGRWCGAAAGTMFGLASLWKASATAFLPGDAVFSLLDTPNVIGTLIMAVGMRTLFGFCAGYLYEKLPRCRTSFGMMSLVSFFAAALHSLFVMAAMLVFFPDLGQSFLYGHVMLTGLNVLASCVVPAFAVPLLAWLIWQTSVGAVFRRSLVQIERTAFYGRNRSVLVLFFGLFLFVTVNLVVHFIEHIQNYFALRQIFLDEEAQQIIWVFGQQVMIGMAAISFLLSLAFVYLYSRSDEAAHRAMLDPLTGLYNKTAIQACIEKQRLSSPVPLPSIFLMLDLDQFKGVNDTFGHPEGDRVLLETSKAVQQLAQAGKGIAGRLGGDEFCVWLRRPMEQAELDSLLMAFMAQIRSIRISHGQMSCSIGVLQPADGKTFEAMYQAADRALYLAKKRGRDQYSFYEPIK